MVVSVVVVVVVVLLLLLLLLGIILDIGITDAADIFLSGGSHHATQKTVVVNPGQGVSNEPGEVRIFRLIDAVQQ